MISLSIHLCWVITSGVVPRAGFLAGASREEIEVKFLSLNVDLEVGDVALQERNRPDWIDLRSDDILAHVAVPAESPIAFGLERLTLL